MANESKTSVSESEAFGHSLSFPKEGLVLSRDDADTRAPPLTGSQDGEIHATSTKKAPEIVADTLKACL